MAWQLSVPATSAAPVFGPAPSWVEGRAAAAPRRGHELGSPLSSTDLRTSSGKRGSVRSRRTSRPPPSLLSFIPQLAVTFSAPERTRRAGASQLRSIGWSGPCVDSVGVGSAIVVPGRRAAPTMAGAPASAGRDQLHAVGGSDRCRRPDHRAERGAAHRAGQRRGPVACMQRKQRAPWICRCSLRLLAKERCRRRGSTTAPRGSGLLDISSAAAQPQLGHYHGLTTSSWTVSVLIGRAFRLSSSSSNRRRARVARGAVVAECHATRRKRSRSRYRRRLRSGPSR